jgi:general secretion pathway protein L
MAESLYLQLPRAGEPVRWLVVDTVGNRIGHPQQGSFADVAAQAKGRRITAFVPAEGVTLTHVEVPSRNPQKVLQAVPFMLEDRLAEDVESLHFALGQREGSRQLVAAIGRAHMRELLDSLTAAGLAPARLIPDVCAITPESATAVAVVEDGVALVRFPDGSGFGADSDLAAQLLRRRAGSEGSDVTRIAIHAPLEEAEAFDAKLGDFSQERVKQTLPDGRLALLSHSVAGQRGLDLLQGDFKQQTSFQEHWRHWRLTAFLLVACLGLGLVQQITSYLHLRHQAAALDIQVEQLFTQAMPGSRLQPGTEMEQMKQRLAALQGGDSAGSLLVLLDALGNGLNTNPSIQITGLNYQSGSLQAQLQAADIGALDALKGALDGHNGIDAKLDSVNASGSQVTGRITLSGGAS